MNIHEDAVLGADMGYIVAAGGEELRRPVRWRWGQPPDDPPGVPDWLRRPRPRPRDPIYRIPKQPFVPDPPKYRVPERPRFPMPPDDLLFKQPM